MWIIQLKHPSTGAMHLLEWDLQKKGPAEGAVLLPPIEFEKWVTDKRPESLGILPTALANVKHHGTSHTNAAVTPAHWLKKSYFKPEGGQGGPYSVVQLFKDFLPLPPVDQKEIVKEEEKEEAKEETQAEQQQKTKKKKARSGTE